MLLSIVMMIKNEEKYLDKTLNALIPLMKDINSELIILDTGSTDNSVEIAKKYTDKVYFDKWNNDFAYMRNISISYAKGDWILILDADEELTDYCALKKFLNTDLCNKYNSASIMLKNIFSQDKKSYNKSPILRIFKNYDGFKFEGAIHEQPKFKDPIYNNLAQFNHYGYLFENEELRQLKENRNKKILLDEIKNKPNNPYINYQLGKTYMISKSYEDALHYIEKGYKIYEKNNYIPVFVSLDLASLYVDLNEFSKCEKLCTKYIKKDNKNIDIYCYLAMSQRGLRKYKQSIESYNRYLYLLENYDISTQSNNVECNGDTFIYKEKCEANILDNYYQLGMYEKVVSNLDDMKIETIENVCPIIFMSLYKLNKQEEIIKIYEKISEHEVQKNKFKINLEAVINCMRENDRDKMYKLLSDMDGNYGILNKIRQGEVFNLEKYNEILKNESELYYGACLYYGLTKGFELEELLRDVNYLNVNNYINHIIINNKNYIVEMYNYLYNQGNTLDINKLKIYATLSKSLLFYGNLEEKKYETLFYMYITYTYDYLKQIYNKDFKDEDLLMIAKTKEEKFVLNIILAQKMKNIDKLDYIKKMKNLLIENKEYKKCIEILIKKFEDEINESEELKKLKENYKSIIEKELKLGRLDNCFNMIEEYEDIFKGEELYDFKAIINIYNLEFNKADKLLKLSYINNNFNDNLIFNIAFVKEKLEAYSDAKLFYNKALDLNNKLNLEVQERLDFIETIES